MMIVSEFKKIVGVGVKLANRKDDDKEDDAKIDRTDHKTFFLLVSNSPYIAIRVIPNLTEQENNQ